MARKRSRAKTRRKKSRSKKRRVKRPKRTRAKVSKRKLKKRKKSKRKSKRKRKGKAFGGYGISFDNRHETLEEVFGKKPITPSLMTKKLWQFIKRRKLGSSG